jgi:hypothetical protein
MNVKGMSPFAAQLSQLNKQNVWLGAAPLLS